jgi:phosphoribosylanthranilate isomerase
MTRAKICGLTNEADLDATIDGGADAVGFIVDVPVDSPREIGVDRACELADRVPPFVTSVLVTMGTDPDDLAALVERVGADALQVYVDNSETLAAIVERVPVPVIGAVDGTVDPTEFAVADAVLVDSLDAAGAGGTGRTTDWDCAREIVEASPVPVILAGGLTPQNVREAVDRVDPFAVDVASGVEAHGGEKDKEALGQFLARAIAPRQEARS